MREKFPSLLLVGIASKNKELHFGGATAAAISAERKKYTVAIPIVHLGWVGLDIECSTILLGQ